MSVFALVFCARAAEVIDGNGFTTGTSFERREQGAFDADLSDDGRRSGTTYWRARADLDGGAQVATNAPGAAYDYAAKGTVPDPLFDDEKSASGGNLKFLSLDTSRALDRSIISHELLQSVSNVLVRADGYDGVYADTLVKFTPSLDPPVVDEEDRIVIWMRETSEGGEVKTNLVVTAGRYAGGYGSVETAEYVLTNVVPANTWCRLTVRAIADVTGVELVPGKLSGEKAPGFTVYVDGKRAVADASYSIGSGYREDVLTPEARVLIAERRLFPWIARNGYDKALALTGFSFSGQGAVDDVLLTTNRLSHVAAEGVFTLTWDSGIRSMTCAVSNAAGVVSRAIDATVTPRSADFALGTNRLALVTVSDVELAPGYSNGVWTAANGCVVTNGGFFCLGTGLNLVGAVASTRNVVGVGTNGVDGSCTTFDEAIRRAKTRPAVIELMSDVVVSVMKDGNYADRGSLTIKQGYDVVLDLKGHVLCGSAVGMPTIVHEGGRLRIIDTVGGGSVVPSVNSGDGIALQGQYNNDLAHMLQIEAGRFDGKVTLVGRANKPFPTERCVIDGGSYTNHNDGEVFYLEQYVTNSSLYFGLNVSNYWSTAATGFIWCGRGENARWSTPGNWQGRKIPRAGDQVIFPRRTGEVADEPWTVDFEDGVAVKSMMMDADVFMLGTNEFSDVAVSGGGRVIGTGVMTFTGNQGLPGMLTGPTGAGKVRLGALWRGTVRIAGVTTPKVLKDIDGWGVAGSKVEFAGVRGYVSDRFNHDLPYELVLTDDGETPAWKNDTGYTGSVVTFPRLSGSGTFDSPKNLKEVLQVFQFEDVGDFTGRFRLAGKRVLLGEGDVADASRAGDFTFSEGVLVRSGLGWEGVSAHFGTALGVRGAIGETLLSYSGTKPNVQAVVLTLHDPASGAPLGNACALLAEDGAVKIVPLSAVSLDGSPVSPENLVTAAKAGSVIEIPAGSAVSLVGNDLIVNGKVVSTFADYYYLTQSGDSYTVRFDESSATPRLADLELVPAEEKAVLQVRNAKPGLWYGLQTSSSPAGGWDVAHTVWKQATDESLTFDPTMVGTALFFRVIMTDVAPQQ